ncbi:MAG: ABC transporter permease [Actinobacteria bacterium]|nr:ABC transporter permease [Actinomycetota bacterium]
MSTTTLDRSAPSTMSERYLAIPTPLRWMGVAALGILVLTIVQSMSGTSLLTDSNTSGTMLRWSIPLLLAALGGLFSERVGIVNIGLEGMMILGTWCGAWGAFNWGPWWGLVAGAVGGALGGLLHAVATINFGVDHIVSGVAINLLGPGLTRYLSERVFVNYEGGSQTLSPRVDGLGNITVPFFAGGKIGGWESPDMLGWIDDKEWFWISDMAGVLRGLLFNIAYFTIVALVLAMIGSWIIWKTALGLRMRSSGENPSAGESLGVNIYLYRYIGVMISGALAGMAGAFIVLELTGLYRGGQTQGRGFIALAALIFGNYKVSGIIVGASLFAYPLGLSFADFDGSATRALLLVITLALIGVTVWAIRKEKWVDAIIGGGIAIAVLIWYLTTEAAPDWLPNTMPYALVLLVLIFNVQKLRVPQAVGAPFRRGDH